MQRSQRAWIVLGASISALGCDASDIPTKVTETDASPPHVSTPADAGAGTPHDGGVAVDSAAPVDAPADHTTDGAIATPTRQSLVWVWLGFADALTKIAAHKESFTHVSPALYTINYDYADGVAHFVTQSDDFEGVSSKEMCDRAHAARLKCVPLVYGGAGNSGTDQGIQNILSDVGGAQQHFIASMTNEAVAKGYDGYNLDWEVSTTGYTEYGTKLVTFLSTFKAALNAKQLELSFDIGGWYTRQCSESGGGGFVDLTTIGNNVDTAIFMAYENTLGSPGAACPSPSTSTVQCGKDFASSLAVMCNVPAHAVSIGLIATDSNPFADQAVNAVGSYGFRNVAVWPGQQFLKDDGMANGATWYSTLADFLAH